MVQNGKVARTDIRESGKFMGMVIYRNMEAGSLWNFFFLGGGVGLRLYKIQFVEVSEPA